jgi:multiple sugar transport system permease protein
MLVAQTGLRNFRMGDAAAMSYILAVFLLMISILNFAVFRERKVKD